MARSVAVILAVFVGVFSPAIVSRNEKGLHRELTSLAKAKMWIRVRVNAIDQAASLRR